ncbi:MAG: pyridoxal-phosphate dependent enzyme [Candidatus Lustribacter sp.]|jgi:threonine dehydratase
MRIPVGGGGLLAGAVLAATELNAHPEIIGVQSEFYPSYYAAVIGSPVTPGGATIADGIAVKVPGKIPLSITTPVVREILLVDEIAIEMAVEHFVERERLAVEGAGAVGIAALLAHQDRMRGRRVGIIVSGGNIDPGLLASIIARARMRSGSVARIRVHILDRPGQLGAIATAVASVGGNVLDVQHHRLMGDVPARYAELDITIELESGTGADTVVAALQDRGFNTVILSGGSHGEP